MQFGPGVATTFLYYFTSTAVVLTFVVSQAVGLSVNTGVPQQFGAIGGLVAGILGAYFNRTVSFTVPFQSQKQFLKTLEATLAQMGYQQIAQEDEVRIYQRSDFSKWFSGRIFVQVEDQQATIASRAVTIRSLSKSNGLGDSKPKAVSSPK